MKKFVPDVLASKSPARVRRVVRLASLIEHELGRLLSRELELPQGVLASISAVSVTADLERASVKVSILPYSRRQEIFRHLKRELPAWQHELNQRLHLYRVPRLELVLDDTEERASRVEALLDSQA